MNNIVVNLVNGDFEVLPLDTEEAWERGLYLLYSDMVTYKEWRSKVSILKWTMNSP